MSEKSLTYKETGALDSSAAQRLFPSNGIGRRLSVIAARLGSRKTAYGIAGVSSATIQRYIAEESPPTFDAAARLCLAAGARMEWLATGEGPMLAADAQEVREPAPPAHKVNKSAPLDPAMLTEAIDLVEQTLALTHSAAVPRLKAELVVVAFTTLSEGASGAVALRNIVRALDVARTQPRDLVRSTETDDDDERIRAMEKFGLIDPDAVEHDYEPDADADPHDG